MSRIRGMAGLLVLGMCCGLLGAGIEGTAAYGATPLASVSADKAIDLNDADEQQLMSVPGIGKTLAVRIIEFRKEHGPFRRVEDLLKVKGVGEKSLTKLRPHITVGESR